MTNLNSAILKEERRERDETMWRENRRVQAMSWGSTGSGGPGGDPCDAPPPKPSRVPATYIGSNTLPKTAGAEPVPAGPTTYLVAPNSEVLAQLMRDNENRSDAGLYTAPASAFNTFTVEFTHPGSSCPVSPQHKSKIRGRKQHQQPVYANIIDGISSPSPIPAKSPPARKKDVRGHANPNNK